MASSISSIAGAAAVLAVLLAVVSPAVARPGGPFHPCNTLFISYTITTTSSSPDDSSPRSTAAFVSVFRIIRPRPRIQFVDENPRFQVIRPGFEKPQFDIDRPINRRSFDQFLSSSARTQWKPAAVGFSSLQERAKDILVVVVGLLFGVGCGALTAATMYLVWSLVSNRFEVCGYEDEDEVESPKKAGYVKIPAAETKTVKEGYEGN